MSDHYNVAYVENCKENQYNVFSRLSCLHDSDKAWYIFLEPQIMAKFLERSYNFSQDKAECDAGPVMK